MKRLLYIILITALFTGCSSTISKKTNLPEKNISKIEKTESKLILAALPNLDSQPSDYIALVPKKTLTYGVNTQSDEVCKGVLKASRVIPPIKEAYVSYGAQVNSTQEWEYFRDSKFTQYDIVSFIDESTTEKYFKLRNSIFKKCGDKPLAYGEMTYNQVTEKTAKMQVSEDSKVFKIEYSHDDELITTRHRLVTIHGRYVISVESESLEIDIKGTNDIVARIDELSAN